MATRARIGRVIDNGDVRSIYSHWDGYPSHVGKVLAESYADVAKIDQLLDNGDVSIIGREIGARHDFDAPREDVGDVCTFYRRDRGEGDVDARQHTVDSWPDYGQEYEYLFRDGSWFGRSKYSDDGDEWIPLAQLIEQDS